MINTDLCIVLVQIYIFTTCATLIHLVTDRFAHFPVRPESFRPGSFRPRVVSPSITWVVSPSYPESFRPLSRLVFYWGYCDKFTVFVSFNDGFGYFLKHLMCPSSAEAKDLFPAVFVSFNEDSGYFLKHLICPSSAEAKDSYTCILFKLTS